MYNVEVRFSDQKWRYIAQTYSLKYAKEIANRHIKYGGVRVRKVVKTIVWKSGKKE